MHKGKTVSVMTLLFLGMTSICPGNSLAKNLRCAVSVADAIRILQNTDRMESKYVAEGADKSKIFCAYAKLVTSPDPGASFDKVFNEAKTDAGKMYSLFWYFANCRKTYELKKAAINQKAEITLVHGCIVDSFSAKQLISQIESGKLSRLLMVDYGEPIGRAESKANSRKR